MNDIAAHWRGVAKEETVRHESQSIARRLAWKSTKEMLAPYKRRLVLSGVLVLLRNVAVLAGPLMVKIGIDTAIPALQRGDNGPLMAVVGVFVFAAVLQGVCDYLSLAIVGRLGQTILFDLRVRLFSHIQRLGLNFQERFTSGRIISRLTSDIDAVDEVMTNGLQQVLWSSLMIVSSIAMLFYLDWRLACVASLFIPGVWLGARWFSRNALNAFRRRSETVALVVMHFVESVRGVAAVQAFRREYRNEEIMAVLDEDYRKAKQRGTRLIAVFGPLVRLLGNISIAAIMLVGGIMVLDGNMTVGVLAAFVLYLRRIVDPAMEMSYFYGSVQSAAAGLEKISLVLAEEPVIHESENAVVLKEVRGAISLRDVTFNYGTDRRILEHLDLEIPAGQTVALVGPTGAGKSSIARLVARLYDPESGTVSLDDIDMRELSLASLRTHVIMVTQENFLFSHSVKDNIRFGRPTATDEDVVAAARAIGADEFIRALPQGYDTTVGKRGAELSAGQRQLIAFARAFLADPQVLILDEATSSLDIPSERLVQHALQKLLADRTAIVIAHRLSTVEIADRVLVIDHGDIVEDGSPGALAARNGEYRRLHDAWRKSMALD